MSTVKLYEMNGGQLIAVCDDRAYWGLEYTSSDFREDGPCILTMDTKGWMCEIGTASDVQNDIEHPETHLICTYSAQGFELHDAPGRAGQQYLHEVLLDAAKNRLRDPQLERYSSYIMADWDEGAEHWYWVATADRREILSWIRAGLDETINTQEPRDQVIRLRCTASEKAQITESAARDGQTVSEYLRSKVL